MARATALRPASVSFPALGTTACVVTTDPRALAEAQFLVTREVRAFDEACSRFRPDSELSGVNASSGAGSRSASSSAAPSTLPSPRRSRPEASSTRPSGAAARARLPARLLVERRRPTPPSAWRRPRAGARSSSTPSAGACARPRASPSISERPRRRSRPTARRRPRRGSPTRPRLARRRHQRGRCTAGGRWIVRVSDDHRAPVTAPGPSRSRPVGSRRRARQCAPRPAALPVHHIVDPARGPRPPVWRTVSVAASPPQGQRRRDRIDRARRERCRLARRPAPPARLVRLRRHPHGRGLARGRGAGRRALMSSILTTRSLWYLARGTGVVSLVLLTAILALGIGAHTSAGTSRAPRFATALLHRNLSLLVLVFLAVHITTSVLDPFAAISWTDAVSPPRELPPGLARALPWNSTSCSPSRSRASCGSGLGCGSGAPLARLRVLADRARAWVGTGSDARQRLAPVDRRRIGSRLSSRRSAGGSCTPPACTGRRRLAPSAALVLAPRCSRLGRVGPAAGGVGRARLHLPALLLHHTDDPSGGLRDERHAPARDRASQPAGPRAERARRACSQAGTDERTPAWLSSHVARYAEPPAPRSRPRRGVRRRARGSGLAGRGRRRSSPRTASWRAVLAGSRRPVVVANGMEGEPASAKFPFLLSVACTLCGRRARLARRRRRRDPSVHPASTRSAARGVRAGARRAPRARARRRADPPLVAAGALRGRRGHGGPQLAQRRPCQRRWQHRRPSQRAPGLVADAAPERGDPRARGVDRPLRRVLVLFATARTAQLAPRFSASRAGSPPRGLRDPHRGRRSRRCSSKVPFPPVRRRCSSEATSAAGPRNR